MQVKNLTFKGGKGAAAQGSSMQRSQKIADAWRSRLEPSDQTGSGCGIQAVAQTWPSMTIQESMCRNDTPLKIFQWLQIDVNTNLVLIPSRNLNTTYVMKMQIDHFALLKDFAIKGREALLEFDKKYLSKLLENLMGRDSYPV